MTNLYDTSLAGLNETRWEVNSLQRKHAWYHVNTFQIQDLKEEINRIQTRYDSKIQHILDRITEQKKHAKEILVNALKQLESVVDTEDIRRNLRELIDVLDTLVETRPQDVLLISIFSAFGLAGLIAAILALFVGASAFGIITLGLGSLVSGTASEVMFRNKLSNLDEKLASCIADVEDQKYLRIQKLNEYFVNLEHKLSNNTYDQNSKINIVWYDKNILSDVNQDRIEILKKNFPAEQYQIQQFNDKNQCISSVRSGIRNNIILITSGSDGEEVISEIGHYFHIKGIILFCMAAEYHRTWAKEKKKVLRVTNSFQQVIEKIQDIENGEIYFVNYGFSFEDIRIKLKQQTVEYYLSTKQNGFIISDFSAINLNVDYHKEVMMKLHNTLKTKHIYPKGIPSHFQYDNLLKFAQHFVEALEKPNPEKHIIRLYTAEKPGYYTIINDILNLLDEELILIIQDYIKALRYSLMIYSDTSNKVPNKKNIKLYRGISLTQDNKFQEFSRKFKINDHIIFPAFTSTSMNKKQTMYFIKEKGVLLEISADCTQLNKPKSISAVSQFSSEDEVLLNCFSILTVNKITQINDDLLCYECTLELH
ncbi:unnamed protein product [Rotaria sp. Silwood2]|nr:unnamed protein product [Rotaria sp. Silwood2]CAF3186976.1 unnamed protein product [Rotaria sp. Silwood2]CAF3485920.1 unnamed protein product [Rotaria sp. Silwood2]